jgi:hypothetical protein
MLPELKDLFASFQGREDLIASKRASGRLVDLEDVRSLEVDSE